MQFRLNEEELNKLKQMRFIPEFSNAEVLSAYFNTDPDIVREILPKPLTATRDPRASVFVAKYPETNFGPSYNEGGLFVSCQYKGEQGKYCLSMPVDNDTALIAGREICGYPKKMADQITLVRDRNQVIASVVRQKEEIIKIEGKLTADAEQDDIEPEARLTRDWDNIACTEMTMFLFKYFLSPRGNTFDYLPRLVRQPLLFRPLQKPQTGKGSVILGNSRGDRLSEISVKGDPKILYGRFRSSMLPAKVVAKVWNPYRFLKHALFKDDMLYPLIEQYDANVQHRQKVLLKLARKY